MADRPAGPGDPRHARGTDPGTDLLTGIAEFDFDRGARRGYPEAVLGEGKSVDQVLAIAAALRDRRDSLDAAAGAILFTRLTPDQAEAVCRVLPDAEHDPLARMVAWPRALPESAGEQVLVLCAGTADIPVAREAWLTARYLGRSADLVVDVGVAGLHRVLARVEAIRSAGAVVVVAGMDGALASVVAGLTSAPVVGVPTSVGYGAALDGLSPLLAMLNACAPGVSVVNIDNGYGAGHLAAQITAPR